MARRKKGYSHYIDQNSLNRISGEPLLTPFHMEGSISGHHRSPHKGSSVEFAEYREYTEGEDPKTDGLAGVCEDRPLLPEGVRSRNEFKSTFCISTAVVR